MGRSPPPLRVARLLVVGGSLLVAGCGGVHDETEDEISELAVGEPVLTRVTENVTACVVDAVCFLRLEFADTTVDGIYGLGERGARPCSIPAPASDAAFGIQTGSVVEVILEPCGSEGLFIRRIRDDDDG